jgi:hypothetical protein
LSVSGYGAVVGLSEHINGPSDFLIVVVYILTSQVTPDSEERDNSTEIASCKE